MERTTFELLRDSRAAGVEGAAQDRIATVLTACDGVKFARRRPATARCRAVAEAARELVLRSLPARSPSAEAAGGIPVEG